MPNIVESKTLAVYASASSWIATGIILSPTDSLRIRAEGLAFFGPNPTDGAWPEGSYLDRDPAHIYDPTGVNPYDGVTDLQFPAFGSDTKPASLVMCLRDAGVTPPSTANSVTDATTTTRDQTFNLPTAGGTKQVWLLFNDLAGNYSNNSGQFSVILDRFNDDDTAPNLVYGPAVGGRTVPDRLWQALQAQAQHPAWCWAIKPINGPWEAYTSLDISLHCPAYVSSNGLNPIPQMWYLSRRAVDLTAIPTEIKMASKSVDVTVLNFDADKLKAGYYTNAVIELFEVDWSQDLQFRWVAFSGLLGNAQVGELSATIQLNDWANLANDPIGDIVTATCRHAFCEAGCTDAISGHPVAADWTRSGTVIGVTTDMKLRVRTTGSTGGSTFLSHLNEGRLTFTSGDNDGIFRDVKTGVVVTGQDIDVVLHVALPYLPTVGDTIDLRAGCKKDTTTCQIYSNMSNFGGAPWVPLKEGVMRRNV